MVTVINLFNTEEKCTLFMEILADKTGSFSWFEKKIREFEENDQITGIAALVCDENGWDCPQTDAFLKSVSKNIMGGIFPGLIHGQKTWNKGTILVGFHEQIELHTIQELSSAHFNIDSISEKRSNFSYEASSILLLVDGMSLGISQLIDHIFYEFGLEKYCIGGGAGSLHDPSKPCLISNMGLLTDSAILCLSKKHISVGVKHGWDPVFGPLRVTESTFNEVKTFDWKPAFKVYKSFIKEHSNQEISTDNFIELAKFYPFGLSRLEEDIIVRDPLYDKDNSSLVFVGDMPKGSFHYILNGNVQSVIQAAKEAKEQAIESFKEDYLENDFSIILVADCISRSLFLGNQIEKELEQVAIPGKPMIGILSFGEIANRKWEGLEFHNKSIVVGVIGDEI